MVAVAVRSLPTQVKREQRERLPVSLIVVVDVIALVVVVVVLLRSPVK